MAFSEKTWRRLTADAATRSFRPGDVLMMQGDPPDFVLFLDRGRVKVTQDSAAHGVRVLAVRGAREIVGDYGVLLGERRSATVTAVDACAARVLAADRFLARLDDLGLTREAHRVSMARLLADEAWRAETSALAARSKVLRALLRFALRAPDGLVDVGLGQAELGLAVNLSRAVIAAELAELRRAGVVSTRRGRIVVLDLDRLEALTESGQQNV